MENSQEQNEEKNEIGAEISKLLIKLINLTEEKKSNVALKEILFYINSITNNKLNEEEKDLIFSETSELLKTTKKNEKPKKIANKVKDYLIFSTLEELEAEKNENKNLRRTIKTWISEKELYNLAPCKINFTVGENIKKSIQKVEAFCLTNRLVETKSVLQKSMNDLPKFFFSNAISSLNLLKKQVVEIMQKIEDFEKQEQINYLNAVYEMTILNENLKSEKIKLRSDNQYLLYQTKTLSDRVKVLQEDLTKMASDNSKIKHLLSKRIKKRI